MNGYFRGAVPEAIRNVMVSGINVPVRIGHVTVMPGDVVLGDSEGVYFIPSHLVQDIVDEAEITHVHDEWTKKKFAEGQGIQIERYLRTSSRPGADQGVRRLPQVEGGAGSVFPLRKNDASTAAADAEECAPGDTIVRLRWISFCDSDEIGERRSDSPYRR